MRALAYPGLDQGPDLALRRMHHMADAPPPNCDQL